MLRRAQRQRPLENLTLGLVGLDGQRQKPLDAVALLAQVAFSEKVASSAVGAQPLWVLAGPESDLCLHLPRQQRVVAAAGLTAFGRVAAVGLRIYNTYPTLLGAGALPLGYVG